MSVTWPVSMQHKYSVRFRAMAFVPLALIILSATYSAVQNIIEQTLSLLYFVPIYIFLALSTALALWLFCSISSDQSGLHGWIFGCRVISLQWSDIKFVQQTNLAYKHRHFASPNVEYSLITNHPIKYIGFNNLISNLDGLLKQIERQASEYGFPLFLEIIEARTRRKSVFSAGRAPRGERVQELSSEPKSVLS
jgi:hypothetical protein